ncbi:MAG: hypothetical protein U1F87_10560 [Kiritimatiellia bacterium]
MANENDKQKQKISVNPGAKGQPVPSRKLPKITLQKGAVTPKPDTEKLKAVPPPSLKSTTTRIKLPPDLQTKSPLRPMRASESERIPPAPQADAVRDAAMNATARILIDQEVVRTPGAVVIPPASDVSGKTIKLDPSQLQIGPDSGDTTTVIPAASATSGTTLNLDPAAMEPVGQTMRIDPATVVSARSTEKIMLPPVKDKGASQTMRLDLSSIGGSTTKISSGPVPVPMDTSRIKLPPSGTQRIQLPNIKSASPIAKAMDTARITQAMPPVAKVPLPPVAKVPDAPAPAATPAIPVAKVPETPAPAATPCDSRGEGSGRPSPRSRRSRPPRFPSFQARRAGTGRSCARAGCSGGGEGARSAEAGCSPARAGCSGGGEGARSAEAGCSPPAPVAPVVAKAPKRRSRLFPRPRRLLGGGEGASAEAGCSPPAPVAPVVAKAPKRRSRLFLRPRRLLRWWRKPLTPKPVCSPARAGCSGGGEGTRSAEAGCSPPAPVAPVVAKAPEAPKPVVPPPAPVAPVVAKAPEAPHAPDSSQGQPPRKPIQMVVKPVWGGPKTETPRPRFPEAPAPAVAAPAPVKPVEAVKPPEAPKPVVAAPAPAPAPVKPVEAVKLPEAPKPVVAAPAPAPEPAPVKPVEAVKPPEAPKPVVAAPAPAPAPAPVKPVGR